MKQIIMCLALGIGTLYIYKQLQLGPEQMQTRNHYRDNALRENKFAGGKNIQTYDTHLDKHIVDGPAHTDNFLEHPGRDLHHADVSDSRSLESVSYVNTLRNTLDETVVVGLDF